MLGGTPLFIRTSSSGRTTRATKCLQVHDMQQIGRYSLAKRNLTCRSRPVSLKRPADTGSSTQSPSSPCQFSKNFSEHRVTGVLCVWVVSRVFLSGGADAGEMISSVVDEAPHYKHVRPAGYLGMYPKSSNLLKEKSSRNLLTAKL